MRPLALVRTLVLWPLVTLAACASTPPRAAAPPAPSSAPATSPAVELGDGVSVRPLAPGVWLHVTIHDCIPANGLLVDTAGGAVLVDSGWDDAQAERLLAFAA